MIFYTQTKLHPDAFHQHFFARINKGTQDRKTFAQNNFDTKKKPSVVSPTAADVIFKIFLKRAAKPSAGNPVEPVEPDLALCQRFPKPSRGPPPQPSPEPVEPDHQGFLEPSPEPSPSPEPCWT